jgi:hypothetical protein
MGVSRRKTARNRPPKLRRFPPRSVVDRLFSKSCKRKGVNMAWRQTGPPTTAISTWISLDPLVRIQLFQWVARLERTKISSCSPPRPKRRCGLRAQLLAFKMSALGSLSHSAIICVFLLFRKKLLALKALSVDRVLKSPRRRGRAWPGHPRRAGEARALATPCLLHRHRYRATHARRVGVHRDKSPPRHSIRRRDRRHSSARLSAS